MNQAQNFIKVLSAAIILSGSVGCQKEPESSTRTSGSRTPRPRVPVAVEEDENPEENPGGGGNPTTTTTIVTTTSGMSTTTTTMSGGAGGGTGPALSGMFTGVCLNGGAYYFKTKYSFSGTSVRIEEMYFSEPTCGVAREGSIYTGTISTGAMNGQGFNIDLTVVRTAYYISPAEDLASFNNPGNPFCGRSSGWAHGENQLEQGSPCRQSFLDFRVYSVSSQALQLSGRGRTQAERSNVLSEVYVK